MSNEMQAPMKRSDPLYTPAAPYSHLTRVEPGSTLYFMSGQIDAEPHGDDDPRELYEQAASVFESIERILRSAALAPQNIVRLLTYLVADVDPEGFYRARKEYFERWFPEGNFPGHSLIYVHALAGDQYSIEIEGWFASR